MDEIKSLLKSILKGKSKEVDPGDLIIDWSKSPQAAGRDTLEYGRAGPSTPKQSRKAGLSSPYGRAGPKRELVIPKGSKKKPAHRSRSASRSSRSESESSDRSGRSSSSSSPSPPRSPSPSPTGQIFIRFDDMNRDLRNALRVSILFVYLPNCILTIFIL